MNFVYVWIGKVNKEFLYLSNQFVLLYNFAFTNDLQFRPKKQKIQMHRYKTTNLGLKAIDSNNQKKKCKTPIHFVLC